MKEKTIRSVPRARHLTVIFFTLTGLVLHLQLERVVKSAWSKYEIAIIRKVLLGWPAQVSLMINSAGYHIEHLL